MATTQEYHDYVVEQLSRAGEIATRRMMGECLVYYRGKLVGDICDNTLYFKQTPSACRLMPDAEKGYPYEGSRTLMLIVDCFEDSELMTRVLEGMYDELPEKKKR